MSLANEIFNQQAARIERLEQEWQLLLSLRNELEFSGIDSEEKANRYDALTEAMRNISARMYL